MRMCHSHHETCQFRAHAITTIASARRTNESANARTNRSCRRRCRRRNPNAAMPYRATPRAARISCQPSSRSAASGSSRGGSSASETTAQAALTAATTTRSPGVQRRTAAACAGRSSSDAAAAKIAANSRPKGVASSNPAFEPRSTPGVASAWRPEERGAHDEGERDQHEPRVSAPACGRRHAEPDRCGGDAPRRGRARSERDGSPTTRRSSVARGGRRGAEAARRRRPPRCGFASRPEVSSVYPQRSDEGSSFPTRPSSSCPTARPVSTPRARSGRSSPSRRSSRG